MNLKSGKYAIIRPTFKSLTQLYRTRNMQLGLPINKSGGHLLPWGYTFHPEHPKDILICDENAFQYLCEAKTHLKSSYSYKKVADWLSVKSGMAISDSGLNDLMIKRQPFDEAIGKSYEERLQLAQMMCFPYNDYDIISDGPFYFLNPEDGPKEFSVIGFNAKKNNK